MQPKSGITQPLKESRNLLERNGLRRVPKQIPNKCCPRPHFLPSLTPPSPSNSTRRHRSRKEMEKVNEINASGPSSSPVSTPSRDLNAQQPRLEGAKEGGLAFEPRANFALAPRITHTEEGRGGRVQRGRERSHSGWSDGRDFEAKSVREGLGVLCRRGVRKASRVILRLRSNCTHKDLTWATRRDAKRPRLFT